MSDTLRDRIVAALEGWVAPDYGLTLADVADAVIRELGLRRQTNETICLAATKYRYVTAWTADE